MTTKTLEQKIRDVLLAESAEQPTDQNDKEFETLGEGTAEEDNAKIKANQGKKLENDESGLADAKAADSGKGDGQDEKTKSDNAKIEAGKSKKLGNAVSEDKDKDEDDDDEDDDDDSDDYMESAQIAKHVNALFEGETLSDEFKKKAETIFEAAVTMCADARMEQIQRDFDDALVSVAEEVRNDLIGQIDGLLDSLIEKWVADNVLALESGVKSEVLENFVDGLKDLFKETYIEIPEEKLDLLDAQAAQIAELEEAMMDMHEVNEALAEAVIQATSKRIQESVGENLTDVEFEKFAGLCEGIEFETEETYEEKLKTLLDSYFPKSKGTSVVIGESDTPVKPEVETHKTPSVVEQYAAALKSPSLF
jgi:hypothetical protein